MGEVTGREYIDTSSQKCVEIFNQATNGPEQTFVDGAANVSFRNRP